jgi:hypothetical protein
MFLSFPPPSIHSFELLSLFLLFFLLPLLLFLLSSCFLFLQSLPSLFSITSPSFSSSSPFSASFYLLLPLINLVSFLFLLLFPFLLFLFSVPSPP